MTFEELTGFSKPIWDIEDYLNSQGSSEITNTEQTNFLIAKFENTLFMIPLTTLKGERGKH